MGDIVGFHQKRPLSPSWTALLIIVFSLGIWAIAAFAFPYFSHARALENFGYARRFGLFIHICAASVALLLGPTQFWMGWTGRFVHLHRVCGMLYLIGVAVACLTAIYLVVTTRRGLVFGIGLGTLTLAWITATAFAYFAIIRRQFVRHYEWMIRSYVLTFVFVTFRLLIMSMKALKIGTSEERLTIAIWLSWLAPLLIVETIIRSRGMRKASVTRPTSLPSIAVARASDLTFGARGP